MRADDFNSHTAEMVEAPMQIPIETEVSEVNSINLSLFPE